MFEWNCLFERLADVLRDVTHGYRRPGSNRETKIHELSVIYPRIGPNTKAADHFSADTMMLF